MRRSIPFRARAYGLALVAILWLVSALSLTALALAKTVRHETRTVSASGQALAAQALADAGLHLAIQAIKLQPVNAAGHRSVQSFMGQQMAVEAVPLTGWIDINRAPAPLLAAAIERLGAVRANRANELATELVAARQQPKEGGTVPRWFVSVEDLLLLPGWDIELWSRLAPYLTANNGGGGGGINPLAAPLPVLTVLAGGDAGIAQRIHNQARAGEPAIDTTGLTAEWVSAQSSRFLHVTVAVASLDGTQFLVKRRVDTSGLPDDGLSWRIIHESLGVESVPPEPVQTTP